MALKVGIILSGAGNIDGSDVQESVFTAISLEKSGAVYVPFAPDLKYKTADGLTRDCLHESSRVYGHIHSFSELNAIDPDALVIPGGAGVLKNLYQHKEKSIFPLLAEYLANMIQRMKPLSVFGYATLIPAAVFADDSSPVSLAVPNKLNPTHEQREFFLDAFSNFNVDLKDCHPEKVIIDDTFNIVSTPGFLGKGKGTETDMDVFIGIEKSMAKLIEFCTLRAQS